MAGASVVLVVDDETHVLRLTEIMLRQAGYAPIAAGGPHEALTQSRDWQGDIHLLLTDVVMPEMSGIDLARQLAAERPDMRVLLMSGYMECQAALPLLAKPFGKSQLLEAVAAALAAPPPGHSDRGRLAAELREAEDRYAQANRDFLALCQDVPSGLPAPDGVFRVKKAAAARRRAFEEYQQARKRLED